jgi:hypothetical protein
MNLECDTEVSPEIEQFPLCFNIEIINHSKASRKIKISVLTYLQPKEIMEAVL